MAKSGGCGAGAGVGGGNGALTWVNNAAKKEESETANKNDSSKKLSVERVYQKKTQLEHILLRPDTYIGSVEPLTQFMWVYDEDVGMNPSQKVAWKKQNLWLFQEILCLGEQPPKDLNTHLISQKKRMMMLMMMMMTIMI
uniref:Macaca fascicularis brain cDNA clone: QmoA-11580, similar to human topoisomerase (DNA) II beta 180kDa (TOP2B), mRNA, RefSeq: NM_001068.2 n=1 Tax=Macaca fascicularis TaxID=9541 RepID=I7GN67_MACFA|nr:unnamed protein product [Macaca fascicularis]